MRHESNINMYSKKSSPSYIFQANGFKEVGANNQDFNIMWTSSNPNPTIYKSLLSHQVNIFEEFVNYFLNLCCPIRESTIFHAATS